MLCIILNDEGLNIGFKEEKYLLCLKKTSLEGVTIRLEISIVLYLSMECAGFSYYTPAFQI